MKINIPLCLKQTNMWHFYGVTIENEGSTVVLPVIHISTTHQGFYYVEVLEGQVAEDKVRDKLYEICQDVVDGNIESINSSISEDVLLDETFTGLEVVL